MPDDALTDPIARIIGRLGIMVGFAEFQVIPHCIGITSV